MPAELGPAATAAAEALGTHAVVAYAIGLAMLLTVVTGVWWASRRYAVGPGDGPRSTARLALRLGVGFGATLFGAWVFAELADELGDGGTEAALGGFDQLVADAIGRSVSREVLQAFATVTHLGDPSSLIVLGALVAAGLLLRRHRGLALGWVVALGGNALLNPALKQIFERVRPRHDDGLVLAHGFSFPSGHSSGSLVAYGMLAYVLVCVLPQRWHLSVLIAAAATVFTVGCSRIFLQVHFLSDVAAGFGSGSAWLAVCIVACEWSRHRAGLRAAAVR